MYSKYLSTTINHTTPFTNFKLSFGISSFDNDDDEDDDDDDIDIGALLLHARLGYV